MAQLVWIVSFIEAYIDRTIEKLLANPPKRKGIGTIFDPRKAIAEMIMFQVGFLGTPWRAKLAVATVAFLTLRMRDKQLQHATGMPAETATDALITGFAVVASQLYFVATNPAFATAKASELAHGIGIGMVMIATVRTFFHVNTPKNDPQQLPEFRVFRGALRINVMWALSVQMILLSNVVAVPGGHLRDFLQGVIPVTAVHLALKFRKMSDRSPFFERVGAFTIFCNPTVEEMEAKDCLLLEPQAKGQPRNWKSMVFMVLFVFSLFPLMGIAVWRWFFGDASNVNWMQLLANLIAVLFLLPTWWFIARFNAAAKRGMRRSINLRLDQDTGLNDCMRIDG